MDSREEAAALVCLLSRPKASWPTIADEVERAGSAIHVLRQDGVGIQTDLLASVGSAPEDDEMTAAQAALSGWEGEGIHVVTLLDPDYPQQLLTIHQRPPLLTYRGQLSTSDAGGVAIVGTRKASSAGLDRAASIADGLALRGVTVVSGLAAGIDTAAHTAALAAGGRSVAVIGTGLNKTYPAENRALQETIGRDHLVLSQFWPDSPPTKFSFPMRNAVMSGFAAATVVIEAEWKSGARMQARLALEHGRPVFLHESLLRHDWAQGYVTRGAVVVRTATDVLDQLAPRLAVADELVWH
ncbi:DNA processing protein [Jatrophihabitans sp. GAS493]|uniref:DNA-processing protein DprA n=1 Tax=Jatrophihabitans sp. GAS493 TaxID=1907575 RepID=UPI000BB7E402|nr:DNA-processing protein DprA [Jatrophihabitans sp. GAS493]SOD71195.1 DNA processing protein [Jatrophihabitans sp. GAS493]